MTFVLADLDFLTSDAGHALLNRLVNEDLSDNNTLSLLTRLRRDYAPEEARSALTLARLRQQAESKFGEIAQQLFFTPEALEQASDPLVRRYRSQAAAGLSVIDAGCGIGADSLALSQVGADVLGVDLDPLRIAMARLNAAALGFSAQFMVGDITADLPVANTIFFDPARRDEHNKRIFDVEQYHPPLSTVRTWTAQHIVVKLSPGVKLEQLAGYDGQVEFISVNGALKEAVLWLGFDRHGLRATRITESEVMHWETPDIMPVVSVTEPQGWLVEPDPAILRAGLVEAVAAAIGATQLDTTIAYLTCAERPQSSWVRSWQIEGWMPFQLKRLRAYLWAHDVGQVTVKKRGVAITLEELVRKLKLRGSQSRTLVLTRCAGQPVVLVCADYQPL